MGKGEVGKSAPMADEKAMELLNPRAYKNLLSLQLTPAYSVLYLYPDHSPLRNKQLLNGPLN